MRDAGPRDARQIVVFHGVAMPRLQQVGDDLPERVRCNGLVALDEAVGTQLEIGEHHLPVERGLDLIDGVLEQNRALPRIGGLPQQMVEKECLAQR